MPTPFEVNYIGRQIDLELLQSIAQPVDSQRVNLNLIADPPKIVTGIQKAVQRYALLLLTNTGDVHFDTGQGVNFIRPILSGSVQNRGRLEGLFALANINTLNQIRGEDAKTEVYGNIPADERVTNSSLLDFDINFNTATVMLRVGLTTAAGSNYTFVVPVTVPR